VKLGLSQKIKNSNLWDIIICSLLKVDLRFVGTNRVLPQDQGMNESRKCLLPVPCREATCFSETSIYFQRTVQRYVEEYRSLQLGWCGYKWFQATECWLYRIELFIYDVVATVVSSN
jgi:hypothetical protein